MNKMAKVMHYLATIGSKTELGGEVITASSGLEQIALVGDSVRYPDGSVTKIISGAGSLLVIEGKPAAIVGSELANGDHIISTPQTGCCITTGAETPIGFLDASYCPRKSA